MKTLAILLALALPAASAEETLDCSNHACPADMHYCNGTEADDRGPCCPPCIELGTQEETTCVNCDGEIIVGVTRPRCAGPPEPGCWWEHGGWSCPAEDCPWEQEEPEPGCATEDEVRELRQRIERLEERLAEPGQWLFDPVGSTTCTPVGEGFLVCATDVSGGPP